MLSRHTLHDRGLGRSHFGGGGDYLPRHVAFAEGPLVQHRKNKVLAQTDSKFLANLKAAHFLMCHVMPSHIKTKVDTIVFTFSAGLEKSTESDMSDESHVAGANGGTDFGAGSGIDASADSDSNAYTDSSAGTDSGAESGTHTGPGSHTVVDRIAPAQYSEFSNTIERHDAAVQAKIAPLG